MIPIQRTIKYESDLDHAFREKIMSVQGCENIWSCIQCGQCSAACPLSIYMDYTPRKIIAMTREGFREEVLSSRTIWLCASCYACAAYCPQNVNITEIMYALKRYAIEEKKYPKNFPIPELAKAFFTYVKTHGRNAEFWVVFNVWRRVAVFKLLKMLPLGWKLLTRRRLPLRRDRIQNTRQLKTILSNLNGEA
ncbi:MAG: 4Fe-4S dicluster domain-containing protein [Calditrichaeota bacterium]|nr:4Fe-4S dicluster domain-containing protein [Calditrichota bacterium]